METTETQISQEQSDLEQKQKPDEPGSSGAAALRRAVDIALCEAADEIADALVKNSIEGHILSAKFVYELSKIQEKDSESESVRKLRLNLVDEWEADKKWLAELRINAAKDAAGWREPD